MLGTLKIGGVVSGGGGWGLFGGGIGGNVVPINFLVWKHSSTCLHDESIAKSTCVDTVIFFYHKRHYVHSLYNILK
jgi:hypothetical protein